MNATREYGMDWAEQLPETVLGACGPLFARLSLGEAMPDLLPKNPQTLEVLELAANAVSDPHIATNPGLVAGLWLYVDDLERSHYVSQGMHDSTGSMWHAILHRREGDFDNSRYWLRQAGGHPAFEDLDGYDAMDLVAKVQAATSNNDALVEMQRKEWAALFVWSALHGRK